VSFSQDELERGFVGKLLKMPELIDHVSLAVDALTDSRHRLLYLAALNARHNVGGDLITGIVSELADRIRDVGGMEYLLRLHDEASTSIRISFEVEQLQQRQRDRQARAVIQGLVDDLGRGADPVELLAMMPQLQDSCSSRFRSMTSAELAAMDCTIDYLIDGIIVKGQPHGWGGPAKGMKTSSALDAAVSLAIGGNFLGYWPAKQVEGVLFLSGESGVGTLQETAERICAVARDGLRLKDLDRLHWCTEIPRLGDDADIRDLRAELKRTGSDVLFVDPLYLCLAEEADGAGNMFKMGPLLRKLSAMTAAIGVTPIVLHHSTRSAGKTNGKETGEPLDLSAFAWAGFSEWVRAWVLINRSEPYEDGSGLHRLNLVAGGSAGHSGCWSVTIDEGSRKDIGGRVWRVQVLKRDEARQHADQRKQTAKEAQEATKVARHIGKLVEVLAGYPGGRTKRDWKDASGLRTGDFNTAFAQMLSRKLVAECTVAKSNGQTYDGYRLTTEDTEGNTVGNSEDSSVQAHSEGDTLIESVPTLTVHAAAVRNGKARKTSHSGTADDPIPFMGQG
jgi:hypothetical protein